MSENTPYSDLKEAIKILEKEQADSMQLLKEQFKVTYESLNPFNILKKTLSRIAESPEIRYNLLGILIPIVTRFINKKAFSGNHRSSTFNQAGILLFEGLNKYVSQSPEIIYTISKFILNIFRKKKSTRPQAE